MFPQPKRAEARLTLRDRVRDESTYAALSDVVLAVRAQDGDRAALAALVERHEPRVRRLAGYLLNDPQDAEDAAQEALAKVLTRIDQFRGEARFATWLYSLVTNTCRDLGERQRRRQHQALETAPEVASSLGPHDLACQREQRAELARELEGLSNDQRHVMVMKDVLALSYEEIAEVLEMPVGTVKCHAHRGRARMRRALEPPAEAVSA
ncbi:MAG TPA: sigma-70 family RNA polymerase sigma factor [Gaiellales bacterium]|jgi:RNA polymerase sigma-70 factor (ECF subfamily)|nr:sigma-70 family RNA polymerase sigma factor [Gaiellales bacterium]